MLEGACKQLKKQECVDKFMIGYRNSAMAAKAWHREKHCFQGKCRGNLRDFEAGFLQGYMDVAAGGDGCVPAIAPEKYWGWRYQSDKGQAGVNAWYEGYPMGVRAAEKDGVGNWGQIRPVGLHQAEANSTAYAPQPVDMQTENPFDDAPVEQYPYEPIMPGEAYGEPLPDQGAYPGFAEPEFTGPGGSDSFEQPVIEDAIPDPLEAPPVEAPGLPGESDSSDFGFDNVPLGADTTTEDLDPRQAFESSEDLVPRGSVGDLINDVNADLSEVFEDAGETGVEEFFGDAAESQPIEIQPAESDVPFTFE